ncbi:MAG: DUF2283 domain-containing protein [Armatimonadetes bacterium]|nr:DUF2283 domain-containing protein [Armatimonadota bacterium]
MRIEYRKDADALYFSIKEGYVAKSKEVEEGVVLDFDEKGNLVGVEILDVSVRYKLSDIVNINIDVENLLAE